MRIYLLALLAVVGCKKELPSPSATTSPAHGGKDADALWALAPANLTVGVVATPRALELAEGAQLAIQELITKAPDLAQLATMYNEQITAALGGPFTSLADVGIDRTKGGALFMTADGAAVVVPVGDRAKLHAALKLGADAGPDRLGPAFCKTIATYYACAKTEAALATLGKGAVPAAITAIGARGELEAVVEQGPIKLALTAQLERGAFVVRGVVDAPAEVTSRFGPAAKPRSEGGKTSAFGVFDLRELLPTLPPVELAPGLTIADVARTIAGPITVTIPTGTTSPDVRVPLSDPAPATKLVEVCPTLLPPEMLAPDQTPGVCKLIMPQYGMTVDLWVEGQELRAGAKGAAPSTKQVAMTALGTELARGTWSLGFWGRGTMFGAAGFGAVPDTLPPQAIAMFRAMSLLSELGGGVRAEGTQVTFVFGLRTLYANPPEVVSKLLAIPPDDIARGKSQGALEIAKASPSSPFAADVAAGQGGLMVPTAVVGMLAAIAIPAFMKYMQRSKQAERAMEVEGPAMQVEPPPDMD